MTKFSAAAEGGEEGRRIHLRDITADTPLDGEEAGTVLRKARLKTGEDLKSVSDKLRIRRPYLEALEESRHDDLPGRAYAIGFVRTYSVYLGLDAAELVSLYKSETEPETEDTSLGQHAYQEVRQDARLPRGSLFILAILLGAGVYGAWLLSVSADRMVTERVPPVPERLGLAATTVDQPPVAAQDVARAEPVASLAGDSASAAGSPRDIPAVSPPAAEAPLVAPEALARVAEETPAVVAEEAPVNEVEVAALTPTTPPSEEPSVVIADDLALAVGGARVYGLENEGARVTVRAVKQAWLRIEAGDGSVLLNQTLSEGEMYRAPVDAGAILVARDAGAFEVFVDGALLGAAGPSGLVLTGKSLNPDDLLRR
ncbi:MAG: helix-turn-helix domain-containing protein [Rhodobiaceae bacterium]|nr:helix-turn-helix domain-containing protein [Rhodobiaceae bacterium]